MNLTPTEAARLMAKYAKDHHAGAFGSPLARELEAKPRNLYQWHDAGEVTVAVIRKQTTVSTRNDWTGRTYEIPKGATVCSFIARTPDGPVPDELAGVDFVYAYAEDPAITSFMNAHHRPRYATRISASSEIITCWGPAGSRHRELPADRPTAAAISDVPYWPDAVRATILAELDTLQQWHDDYPFYSDGTWGAVNLRGFNPADPLWGVKPAEMPRKWNDEHPGASLLKCDWTVITAQLPGMRAIIEDVRWWNRLERVRLMRMEGRPGGGKLGRHTDVTDRAAGTRDGQIARFHIPLVTHPDIKMHTWELDGTHNERHLEPWTVYYLDQRKPHAVTNPTETDRVHLVVDVVVDEGVRKRLEAA